MARETHSGIFWTWQDAHVEAPHRALAELEDIAAHGFDAVLLQPRGCRYGIDDLAFIQAVVQVSQKATALGLGLWFHLDPRSFTRSLLTMTGEAAEFLVVAGTGADTADAPWSQRRIDIEGEVRDGRFSIRLEYPKSRPYHVHSDGALTFRPLRLERALAFTRDDEGLIVMGSVRDITPTAHFFTNELVGYVEVFGRWQPPTDRAWRVVAFVSFVATYPDYAGPKTRAALAELAGSYADAGARLAGLWWDEPGYCTGFDRNFRADRGRIPYGRHLARLHEAHTGRSAADELLYLLFETDDGLWGERRRAYYRTLQEAVVGAQQALTEAARARFGSDLRMGVHQTWHQNGDDVLHGSGDWWRGCRSLSGGFTDVGSAEEVDDPEQMGEMVAMAALALGLARRAERPEAYLNLWGVDYGRDHLRPGEEIIDWWADLMATFSCRWLAHTYGPTGYFERPSAWGPGYPDHPTWTSMPGATERLRRALEAAHGRLPRADVALVYPVGTLFRLGSDLSNPLCKGVHRLTRALLTGGYELDIIAPELLPDLDASRYRGVLYLHPFGATDEDVAELARLQRQGARVIAAGLPIVTGRGWSGATSWRDALGLSVPEVSWNDLLTASQSGRLTADGKTWRYLGIPGWGRPVWRWGEDRAPHEADAGEALRINGEPAGSLCEGAAYLPLLLEGLAESAPEVIRHLDLEPGWKIAWGALATRTPLPDDRWLLKACPARFAHPFEGTFVLEGWGALELGGCHGLATFLLGPGGVAEPLQLPPGTTWQVLSEVRA